MDVGLEDKSLAVIGAGPKAAALAAKAKVLRDHHLGNVDVLVFEQIELAANWKGRAGFTDGQGTNVTPPEKDVGFPYKSPFGIAVDNDMMLKFSWSAYLISLGSYADWIDRGSPRPRHEAWGGYVDWVLGQTSAQVHYKTISYIERAQASPGKLVVVAKDRTGESQHVVDGVVFTGPGPIRKLVGEAEGSAGDIDDAKSYWRKIDDYAEIPSGKVAVIGGGETAASVAISVLDRNPRLTVEIINRHGTLFTRGESFFENQIFSSNVGWAERRWKNRSDIIKRSDRGIVSAKALARLSESAGRVHFRGARVESFEKTTNDVRIRFDGEREDVSYDRVINATGFDNWAALELLSNDLHPQGKRELSSDEQEELPIDSCLRLPTDDPRVNIHVPMISGVSQGPGLPGLSSLGLLADMILGAYVPTPSS